MTRPLEFVGVGDPTPRDRETWNAMIAAGRLARESRGGASVLPGAVHASLDVLVRNDTGDDLPAFSLLKLGDPITSATEAVHELRRMPAFAGSEPDDPANAFGVTLEPIPDGETGRATVSGIAIVSLVVNDDAHGFATLDTSVEAMQSAESGPAKIIWKSGDSGTVTAVVLLQGDMAAAESNVSSWKSPVRVATTANGTLATAFENGDTVDGVTLATGDRILIKNQSSAAENGIYVVAASGAPARATDADSEDDLLGATVAVTEGTANADTVWLCTANATITVDSTSLAWRQINVTSGEASYSSAFFVTTTGFLDTGYDITLPSAGTYIVHASANCTTLVTTFAASSFPPGLGCRLYDETAAAAIADTNGDAGYAVAANLYGGARYATTKLYTVTVPTTIRIEVARSTTGGHTYDSSSPSGTRVNGAYLCYQKIG